MHVVASSTVSCRQRSPSGQDAGGENREGLFEGEHNKVLGACGEKQE